jgi:hypothetical protein
MNMAACGMRVDTAFLSQLSLAEPWMIFGTLSRIFAPAQISETASRIFLSSSTQQTSAAEKDFAASPGATPEVLKAWVRRFSLGWSHYVELLTLGDSVERRFYEIEAAANQWTGVTKRSPTAGGGSMRSRLSYSPAVPAT